MLLRQGHRIRVESPIVYVQWVLPLCLQEGKVLQINICVNIFVHFCVVIRIVHWHTECQ